MLRFGLRHSILPVVACAVIVLSVMLPAGSAFGQGEGEAASSPTEEQRQLNDEAVRAIGDEDYTKAISYLEESLYLGEFNITYLNLGRAYQSLGRCEKARASFEKVFVAPKVDKPAAEFIEAKAKEYQSELDEICQPKEDPSGPPAEPAESAPTSTEPAESASTSAAPDGPQDDRESASPPTSADDEGARHDQADDDAAGASRSNTLGLIATVGGIALVGAGVGAHLKAESLRDEVSPQQAEFDRQGRVTNITQAQVYENQSAANTLDTVGLSVGIAGGLVAATGVYLLVTGNADEDPTLTVGPRSDGAGFVIDGRF